MWSRCQMSASRHVETVFPRLDLFIWQFMFLATKSRWSLLMLGYDAIILTDASVAFLSGCVSCTFAINKYLSLCGNKDTTPLKTIPLCKVKSTFCSFDPLSTSEPCSQLPLLIRFILSWKCLFVPSLRKSLFRIDFCLGHQITPSEVTKHTLCRIRHHQNLSCSKHQHAACALMVYTSTQNRCN